MPALNTYPIWQCLRFLIRSTNQHGVHSPFVFDLVTKCFYNRKHYPEYNTLKAYRKKLYNNHTQIPVTDFGAGSRVFNSHKRSISDMAKNAGISPKRNRLLFRIQQYFKPENSLELGTSLGLATAAMGLGNPKGCITSLEGCPETAKFATARLGDLGMENTRIVNCEFDNYLQTLTDTTVFDLVFFDGNHTKEATLRYFHLLLKTKHNNTVWIFDDIYWSGGMAQAWEIIKQHPEVTVTIDTFYWGLVFFRKEQLKQNFRIRV